MPCFTGNVVNNQIIFVCHLTKSGSDQVDLDESTLFRALLDTGAQRTCITKNVVEKLGMEPVSWSKITGVGGEVDCPEYMVDIVISVAESKIVQDNDGNNQSQVQSVFGKGFQNTSVAMLDGNHQFDVLLGMDLITQCNFSIHSGQLFTLCI